MKVKAAKEGKAGEGVISSTTPELTQDVCIADGCNNAAVQYPEWDNEYCSVSCAHKHCKAMFIAWLANNKYANIKATVTTELIEAEPEAEQQQEITSTTP